VLIHVALQGDRSEVAWMNRIHHPDSGIVVVHVPPACDLRVLTGEVLRALDRPVAVRAKTPGRDLAAWVAAWLRSARPRCDLVLYGAWRLRPTALRWLKPLAAEAGINVWLLSDRGVGDTSVVAGPAWHWETFRTQPWRGVKDQDFTNTGPPTGAGDQWLDERLPPFPFWNLRVLELLEEPFLAVARLYREYLRIEGQLHDLLHPSRAYGWRSGPPDLRDVLAAVARVTMIDRDPRNLAVFLRFLEETVWWSGGLVTFDIDAIAAAVNPPDPADRVAPPARYDPFEPRPANPQHAARYEIARTRSGRQLTSAVAVDTTPDGGTLVLANGHKVTVPFESRWAVRAALALADHGTAYRLGPTSAEAYRPGRRADPEQEDFEIVRRLEFASSSRGPHDRSTLERLSRHLGPHVGYSQIFNADDDRPLVSSEKTPLAPPATDTMPVAAAVILHQLWISHYGNRVRGATPQDPPPDDPGVRWLASCGLVERDLETNRLVITPNVFWALNGGSRRDALSRRFIDAAYHDEAERTWSLPAPDVS
jgi:hypothetical protein